MECDNHIPIFAQISRNNIIEEFKPDSCELFIFHFYFITYLLCIYYDDRLCGLVVRVLGYRSGFDSRHYQKKKVVGLERGPLGLVSTTEELLDRKVAAPV
jgi:hypothetical protein